MVKFELGSLLMTNGIHERFNRDAGFRSFVYASLARYKDCDWGKLSEEDKKSNDEAVETGERILAAYIYPKDNTKIWIITEGDRSATTILFPDEY